MHRVVEIGSESMNAEEDPGCEIPDPTSPVNLLKTVHALGQFMK